MIPTLTFSCVIWPLFLWDFIDILKTSSAGSPTQPYLMYSIFIEVGPGVCSNIWCGMGRRTAVIIIYESLLIELSHFYYDKSGLILFMHFLEVLYLYFQWQRSCTTICEDMCVKRRIHYWPAFLVSFHIFIVVKFLSSQKTHLEYIADNIIISTYIYIKTLRTCSHTCTRNAWHRAALQSKKNDWSVLV